MRGPGMGAQETTVRNAEMGDFDGVSAVFAQENSYHVGLLPSYIAVADPPIPRDEFDEILASQDRRLLVAERDGSIVGVAYAGIKTSPDMPFLVPRSYAYVMDVAVDEAHRGSGLGRALMTAVQDWARESGCRDIELNVWARNEKAIGFYERLGYAPLDIKMTKRL